MRPVLLLNEKFRPRILFGGKPKKRWNIQVGVEGQGQKEPRGIIVNQPKLLPEGALVGIRGAPVCTEEAEGMPLGDKGCIIADPGTVPVNPDLHKAQLRLRLEGKSSK